MAILFFAGALRTDSSNKKFAREALRLAESLGKKGQFVDLRDYDMPLYDGDVEASSGIPAGVKKLGEAILAADALVISMPEYNSSISGVLKNALDWVSRIKPSPWDGKHTLLLGASPGAMGAIRCLYHARQIFDALGMYVFPGTMGLAKSYEAFDENGKLKDEKQIQQLQSLLEKFIKHAGI